MVVERRTIMKPMKETEPENAGNNNMEDTADESSKGEDVVDDFFIVDGSMIQETVNEAVASTIAIQMRTTMGKFIDSMNQGLAELILQNSTASISVYSASTAVSYNRSFTSNIIIPEVSKEDKLSGSKNLIQWKAKLQIDLKSVRLVD